MIVKLKYMGVIHDNMPDMLELEEGSDLNQLKSTLIELSSEDLKPIIQNATFIVNDSSAKDDTILNENDKIIVLTPLGGG
ncbi:MAG: MoaD/ThiS family protein [Tissierellales bacterium]|nr:MoaD/ThiS family protein [Tissierellales bacterium]